MKNIITTITNGISSPTLTTRALSYLIEAQSLYGLRTMDFIYGGVEVANVEKPHVYFMFGNYIIIRVTPHTIDDEKQAIIQIAHEVIHVISPINRSTTNNLEEGLATYFSLLVTARDTGDKYYGINSIMHTKYASPCQWVTDLLDSKQDAIIELRKVQPVLGQVVKEDFVKAKINISEELLRNLVRPMEYL